MSIPSTALLNTKTADPPPIPWLVPEEVREGFRALRASLIAVGQPLSVAVTSLMPGEGVSWIAAKLACAFAEASDGVVLIDAGGTKAGAQMEAFGLHGDPVSDHDLRRRVATNYLTIATLRTAGDLRQIRSGISECTSAGSTVVIDCEPVSRSAQVLQLANAVTGVLLVIEAERDRREALAAAIAKFERAGLPVLGTVLNKRRKYVPRFLYGML